MRAELNHLAILTASTLLLTSSTGLAQEENQAANQPGSAGSETEVAQQCLDQLAELNNRMDEDGYWIAGWGSRWGQGPAAPATPPPAASDTTTTTGDATAAPDTAGPWMGPRWGVTSPRYQIQTLHEAAAILGHRGDQQACDEVLAELHTVYDGYVRELNEAGVEPNAVGTWRQERIAMAKPVTELKTGAINVADITGTEVRNLQDEELGTIEDVIIDRQSGGISYVVVSSGGFWGIGNEHVAVPWNALKATPGLNTFVLDVSEQAMEQAPKVDPEAFVQFTQQDRRDEIDSFWEEQTAG